MKLHLYLAVYKRAQLVIHRTLDIKHKKMFSADDLLPVIKIMVFTVLEVTIMLSVVTTRGDWLLHG